MTDSLIAGSVSGAVCRVLTLPFDVLKIRLQLQTEPLSRSSESSKYYGFTHATKTILREEGFQAFWKGLMAGEILYVIYGAVQFSMYDISTRSIRRLVLDGSSSHAQSKVVVSFVGGCVAGTSATVVSFPFDVLKTRMIGQGEPKVYPNVYRAIIMMYKENGTATFFRGLSPALFSVVPQAGLYFTVYNFLCSVWRRYSKSKSTVCSLCSLTFGATAGVVSKTVVLPLDLVKKRLEVQGFERARLQFGRVQHYSGFVDCFRTVLHQEGWIGFYKGALPTIIKAAVSVGISFSVYEKVLYLLHHRRDRRNM